MASEIQQFDTRVVGDDLLEELWHYYHEIYLEEVPDDSPPSLERAIADWRSVRPRSEVSRWVLRRDGVIKAAAVAYIDLEENLENGFGRIHVTTESRGRGHARELAATLFDWLEDRGRTRFHTGVNKGVPLDGFLARLGLKEAYHDQRSRLDLSSIDQALMQSWIDGAVERAADYELVELDSPVSEAHLQRYCDILFQMNTAPKEDFEEEDETMTPERWRQVEQTTKTAGYRLYTMVAVHRPTGMFAGSSTISADLLDPKQGWQWETVVHPEHRERGLGRWLKAAMIELVTREHPEMERIDTENSVTNDAMLGINIAMGFRPINTQVIWQGDLSVVRQRWGV